MADDMISRQAALNCVYGTSPNKIKGRIAELPPAQPEQPEWVQAVERWYNKALCNPCIHKPLAWALYQVWKEYDNEG